MSTHERRSRLILSDNPRWFAGTPLAVQKHDVAEALRSKFSGGVFLYNRRANAGKGETRLDIMAMVGSGIWLIEVQDADGSSVTSEGRRGFFGSRYDRLMVAGEDQAPALAMVARKAAVVAAALPSALSTTPVRAALCIVDAKPALSGSRIVDEVTIAAPRDLLKAMQGHGSLRDADITPIALSLGEQFPRPKMRP